MKFHNHQIIILKELLFKPDSKFKDLNIKDLTSDHFSYHINALIDHGLVRKKITGKYELTNRGKEIANTLDTDHLEFEKSPKVAVMLIIIRESEEGKLQLLMQERLKQPYFGYKAFLTGKCKFGELIEDTAQRELEEETGFTDAEFKLKFINHEIIRNPQGELLEDKLMHTFICRNPKGEYIEEFEGGRNFWIDMSEFKDLSPKYYHGDMIFEWVFSDDTPCYIENEFVVEEF